MTAVAGLARTTPRTLERGTERTGARRPALELVPAAGSRTRRLPFAAVVVALLAGGLLGLLVLNTVLAQDAFRLHTLKTQSRELEDREQALQREVEALRAPQALAARAGALGMVQAGPPAFLRLPDGAVLGAETAAESAGTAGTPEAAAARQAPAPATPAITDDATSSTSSTDSTGPAEDDE